MSESFTIISYTHFMLFSMPGEEGAVSSSVPPSPLSSLLLDSGEGVGERVEEQGRVTQADVGR